VSPNIPFGNFLRWKLLCLFGYMEEELAYEEPRGIDGSYLRRTASTNNDMYSINTTIRYVVINVTF
jgi:hypothetical protein